MSTERVRKTKVISYRSCAHIFDERANGLCLFSTLTKGREPLEALFLPALLKCLVLYWANGCKQGRAETSVQKEFFTSAASPASSQQGTSHLSRESTFCHLGLYGQCSHNNWSNNVHVPMDGAKYVLIYRQVGKKKKKNPNILGGDGQCSVLQSHMLWWAISNIDNWICCNVKWHWLLVLCKQKSSWLSPAYWPWLTFCNGGNGELPQLLLSLKA